MWHHTLGKGLRNALAIFALILFVIVGSTTISPNVSEAILGGIPFGGKVITTTPCVNGILMTIERPIKIPELPRPPEPFLYIPPVPPLMISKLYKYYSLYTSQNVIGITWPSVPGTVYCYLPPPLAPIPVEGVIRSIGTSVAPL